MYRQGSVPPMVQASLGVWHLLPLGKGQAMTAEETRCLLPLVS